MSGGLRGVERTNRVDSGHLVDVAGGRNLVGWWWPRYDVLVSLNQMDHCSTFCAETELFFPGISSGLLAGQLCKKESGAESVSCSTRPEKEENE